MQQYFLRRAELLAPIKKPIADPDTVVYYTLHGKHNFLTNQLSTLQTPKDATIYADAIVDYLVELHLGHRDHDDAEPFIQLALASHWTNLEATSDKFCAVLHALANLSCGTQTTKPPVFTGSPKQTEMYTLCYSLAHQLAQNPGLSDHALKDLAITFITLHKVPSLRAYCNTAINNLFMKSTTLHNEEEIKKAFTKQN